MQNKIKYAVFISVILTVIFIMAVGATRAGDIFLSFIGEKIHIDIGYKNHSGFLSCFLLRFIELERPVFTLKDFDLALGCQRAFIEPKFNRLLRSRTIVLSCAFENASFLGLKEKNDAQFLAFFEESFGLLFDRLSDNIFKNMHTELVICGKTVEFPFLEAHGEYAMLCASGFISESGSFSVSAKIFFSPKIVEDFSEELRATLTEESRGWLSYYFHIESGQGKSFLKLESDRFRLNFEQLDVK